MLILYLVRHGETELGSGIVAGSTDVALSAEGAQSIRTLRELWLDGSPDILMSSPLTRTRETAGLLGAKWGLELRTDPRLVEMDFGEWEGQAWDDVCEHDADRFRQWSADWVREPAPGGESFGEVAKRCAGWLQEASKRLDNKTVVVVAHSGTIRALICLAMGIPLDLAMKFTIDYGRVTGISISDRSTRCLYTNAQTVPNRSAG